MDGVPADAVGVIRPQVAQDDERCGRDPSMRDLLPFQKDGVGRARRILEKHNGVLIADEVGLGKTYVGGALVKDTVRARQRVLIIAPKIIRDSVWKPYMDRQNLSGWVDVISYDDLLQTTSRAIRRTACRRAGIPTSSRSCSSMRRTPSGTPTRARKAAGQILKGNPRKRSCC